MASDLRERLAVFRDGIFPLQYLLLNGTYPPYTTNSQKRTLRRQKHFYMVKENKLYRKRSGKWVEVVTSPGEVMNIIKFCHVKSGAHVGIVNTKSRVAEKYYWHLMSKDVSEYIAKCPTCQSSEPVRTQAATLTQSKVSQPMQVVGMDLIGNHKSTAATWVMEPAIEFVSVEVKEEALDDQVLLPSLSGVDRVSSHPQDPLSQPGMTHSDHPQDALCQYNIIHVKEHHKEEGWVKDEPVEPMDHVTGSLTTLTSRSGSPSRGSVSQEAAEDLASPSLADNKADGRGSPPPAPPPSKGRGGKRFPIWSCEASQKLIQLVKENSQRMDDGKNIRPIIWQEITEALQSLVPGVSQQQVQMKWRISKARYLKYKVDRREGKRRKHRPMHYQLMSSFVPDVKPVSLLEGASSSPLNDTGMTQYDPDDLPESDELEPPQDAELSQATEPSQAQETTKDVALDQPPEQPQATDADQPPSTAMATQQTAQHPPPSPPPAEAIKSTPSTETQELLEILKDMRDTLDELFVSSAEYHKNQLNYLESVIERDAEKHRIDMKIKEEQLQILRL